MQDTIDVGVPVKGLIRTKDAMLPGFSGYDLFGPVASGTQITPVEILLLDLSYVLYPSVRVSEAYGQVSHVTPGARKRPRGTIRQTARWDDQTDRTNYANNLVSLLQFPVQAPNRAEKGVVHAGLIGDYRPVGTGLYSVYSKEMPFYGSYLKCPEEFTNSPSGYTLPRYVSPSEDSLGHNQNPSGDAFSYLWGGFAGFAEQLAQYSRAIEGGQIGYIVPQLGWNGFGDANGSFRFFQYALTPQPSFSYEGMWFGYYYACKYQRSVRINVVPTYSSGVPTLDGSALRFSVHVTYEDTCEIYYDFPKVGYWRPLPDTPIFRTKGTLSSDDVQSGVVSNAVGVAAQHALDVRVRKAVMYRDRDLSNQAWRLRRYAPLAVSDAVDKFKVSSNYIEALMELDGVGEYLYGPLGLGERLLELIARFGARPKSLKGIWYFLTGIADILSSLTLFYSFGVKPSAEDVNNALRTSATLREIARVFDSEHYGRGDSTGVFVHGPHQFKLKVRSKFAIPKVSPGIAMEALRLDRRGLFPSPSRLLDNVPFFFIIEYAVKVGARWGVIENSIFLSYLRAHTFVNSYELRLKEGIPKFLGVDFEPLHDCEFVFYAREVSAYVPDFSRDGPDNVQPPRGPNSAVVLSLLWQLVKSFF